MKSREGNILRIGEDKVVIARNLFKKENSNVDKFIGSKVFIKESPENKGTILSSFGTSGKIKIQFETDIENLKVEGPDGNQIDYKQFTIVLEYKKYLKYKF